MAVGAPGDEEGSHPDLENFNLSLISRLLGVLVALAVGYYGVVLPMRDPVEPPAQLPYAGQTEKVARMLERLRDATKEEINVLAGRHLLPDDSHHKVYVSTGDVPGAETKLAFTVILQPGHRWLGNVVGRAAIIRYDARAGGLVNAAQEGRVRRFYDFRCDLETLGRLEPDPDFPRHWGCDTHTIYDPEDKALAKSMAKTTRALSAAEQKTFAQDLNVVKPAASTVYISPFYGSFEDSVVVYLPKGGGAKVAQNSRLGLNAIWDEEHARWIDDPFCLYTSGPPFPEADPATFLEPDSITMRELAACR